MKQRGFGRMVFISSGAGLGVSLTGIQAYASAKAGVSRDLGGVDDKPLTGDLTRLGGVRAHDAAPVSRSSGPDSARTCASTEVRGGGCAVLSALQAPRPRVRSKSQGYPRCPEPPNPWRRGLI